MPLVHNKAGFRPALTVAKRPSANQKLALVERAAETDRKHPVPPKLIYGNRVALDHFAKLVRQMHPEDFDNQILVDYLAMASLVWSKMRAVLCGLMDDSIPNTILNSAGTLVKSPEFIAVANYQNFYERLLADAGLKDVNRINDVGKARAKAARNPRAVQEDAHKATGQDILALLAQPKRA